VSDLTEYKRGWNSMKDQFHRSGRAIVGAKNADVLTFMVEIKIAKVRVI
jgi:hypothetical protein